MRWYAVMAKPRKEHLANLNLRYQGYETFFPHYRQWTTPKKTKPREIIKPYLARYLFVGMTGGPKQSVYNINSTIGVSTVVYCGFQALPIPLEIIYDLKDLADEKGEIFLGKKEEPPFPGKQGDWIKFVRNSPLAGLMAEFQRVDKTGRLVVKLSKFLGAEREVTIDRADVGALIPRDEALTASEPTGREQQLPANSGSLRHEGES